MRQENTVIDDLNSSDSVGQTFGHDEIVIRGGIACAGFGRHDDAANGFDPPAVDQRLRWDIPVPTEDPRSTELGDGGRYDLQN